MFPLFSYWKNSTGKNGHIFPGKTYFIVTGGMFMNHRRSDCYEFENTPLPYAFNSLEPYIDAKTMELHYNRHLQAYVDNLNAALSKNPGLQKASLEQLIMMACRLPNPLGTQIRNNAGGEYNHRFYFAGLRNPAHAQPSGCLEKAIEGTYGSFEKFREAFKAAAMSVFGSGYAWLMSDLNGRLRIVTTANQDTPLGNCLYPILNIDVWEHAYYLKHYNKRGDYIDSWFRVVNWDWAERNYLERGKKGGEKT